MHEQNRHICTERDPWTKDKAAMCCHPDAVCTREGDHSEDYHCPHCGHDFTITLPDA
jgi:hypothetical protein